MGYQGLYTGGFPVFDSDFDENPERSESPPGFDRSEMKEK
jgi:hypothetical protein